MKSNFWRLKEYCSSCPFQGHMHLDKGRLQQIKDDLLADDHSTFICHKTLDGEYKTCYGAYVFLKEQGRPNLQMRLERIYDDRATDRATDNRPAD